MCHTTQFGLSGLHLSRYVTAGECWRFRKASGRNSLTTTEPAQPKVWAFNEVVSSLSSLALRVSIFLPLA